MFFNFLIFVVFALVGKGFFGWNEEYLIALGLFLVIYFLYSLLKASLFNSLNEQIDKITFKFIFSYSLNILMLKIFINIFKKELDLKNAVSLLYVNLSYSTISFSNSNKEFLIFVYKNNMNHFLSKLVLHHFDANKKFYLGSTNNWSDLNKFILILEKVLFKTGF